MDPMDTLASWIAKNREVNGGDACVRHTTITVWSLVKDKRSGLSDQQIKAKVPGLTDADLDCAWAYAVGHAEEIKAALEQHGTA